MQETEGRWTRHLRQCAWLCPASVWCRADSLVRLSADPGTDGVHEAPRLHGAKLTGIEELAITHRTRLVPHRARAPIEYANHRCVAAWTINPALLVAPRSRRRARRIQQIDACLRVHVHIFERVEPKPLTRRATIDLRLLDLHRLHRSPALWTRDLHSAFGEGGAYKTTGGVHQATLQLVRALRHGCSARPRRICVTISSGERDASTQSASRGSSNVSS